ncbi:choice-of-anchor B family protein [Aestuariibacter salexigens]|uniref:choice-of-anchor B family protein n=1 Tax=Aestuariibacter salexigens TaxID=226010 RepID=UPI0003FB0437|nr:choice-of-anchor B family protein [Aestuariibacter salexigens]
MKTFIVTTTILLLIGGISQEVKAHGEGERARFVATNGTDKGDCKNRFRPCRSIAYAARQANKGDEIQVAQGQYQINDSDELFYLVSQIVPVKGGYSPTDHYQIQNPDAFLTTLSGIPSAYAKQLRQQGFHIIVDNKGNESLLTESELASVELIQNSQSSTPCNNGSADGFSCRNISLMAHIALNKLPTQSSSANDIWGHVDLNTMKEYAIIGLRSGIAVIDVSSPTAPRVIGSVGGQSTTWRDIKVYQYYDTANQRWRAYAYATADSVSEGLSILDLNDLANGVSLVTRETFDRAAHNVYISNVEYSLNIALPGARPQLHITGSPNFGGAWRSFSLAAPTSIRPTYSLQDGDSDDYTHDASSVLIDDARATTDCVNAGAEGCTVMLDFNENTLRLWDHSRPDQSIELAEQGYPNSRYTHSGWWSEDKQYVFVHDEIDEQSFGLNTTLNIFDISSLTNPVLVGTWSGPTRAIDHNGFVRGNRYYMSNYTRGLTILDISDPANPIEVGFFDTFPSSDGASFNGAWGVYPYLPSGTILVSDIQGGLYILKDETLGEDTLSFEDALVSVEEGTTATFRVNKQETIATEVDYEVLTGSASGDDIITQRGTLTWLDGDTQSKTINVEVRNDDLDEPSELFFVKLSNPSNGVTLTPASISMGKIRGENISQGVITLASESLAVRENQGVVEVNVERNGGTDENVSVTYALESGTANVGTDVQQTSGTLTWLDGDSQNKVIRLFIYDDADAEENEQFTLTLSAEGDTQLGSQQSLNIVIRDDESNQAPVADAGQDLQVNTRQSVSLSGSATDDSDAVLELFWAQTAGPDVNLVDYGDGEANFTAPEDSATLTFELSVTDDFGAIGTDVITVTVVAPAPPTTTPPPSNSNSSGGGGSTSPWLLAGILLLTCWRLRKRALNRI